MSVSDSVSGERTSVRGVRVLQDFITHYDGIDGTTPTMLRFRAGEHVTNPVIASWLLAKHGRHCVLASDPVSISCPACRFVCDVVRDECQVVVVQRDCGVSVDEGSPQFFTFKAGTIVVHDSLVRALEAARVPTVRGKGIACPQCGCRFY